MPKLTFVLIALMTVLQAEARVPAITALRTAALISARRDVGSKGDSCGNGRVKERVASLWNPTLAFNERALFCSSHNNVGDAQKDRDSVKGAGVPRITTFRLPYDVNREGGAYLFDTVYKLRIPAKIVTVSLNAGYTFYNNYVYGSGIL